MDESGGFLNGLLKESNIIRGRVAEATEAYFCAQTAYQTVLKSDPENRFIKERL